MGAIYLPLQRKRVWRHIVCSALGTSFSVLLFISHIVIIIEKQKVNDQIVAGVFIGGITMLVGGSWIAYQIKLLIKNYAACFTSQGILIPAHRFIAWSKIKSIEIGREGKPYGSLGEKYSDHIVIHINLAQHSKRGRLLRIKRIVIYYLDMPLNDALRIMHKAYDSAKNSSSFKMKMRFFLNSNKYYKRYIRESL